MCLGIPAQIVAIADPARKLALAEVSGVRRQVNVAPVMPESGVIEELIGAWVLLHVGFAMSRIDVAEAAKTLALLIELGEAQAEIDAIRASAA